MKTIEFDKLFDPRNKSVLNFFRVSGVGYYIPDYQREYSWDKENIEQLMNDIMSGVERLAEDEDADNEIHFLGTVITVREQNGKNKDPKGEPTRIDMIIDGQQRIITISILASIFIKNFTAYLSQFKETSVFYDDVKEIVEMWNNKLFEIVSFDLSRGIPKFKPRVIRGGTDYWIAEGDINKAYKSELANYQARFINTYLAKKEDPSVELAKFEIDSLYSKNCKRMEKSLNKIKNAHINGNDDYPNALQIINCIPQEYLWDYQRANLVTLVERQFTNQADYDSSLMCSFVQTIAACYYLLERCCLCVINAEKEDWAFDMFQSLNATGTPLTAIETFKPVVINDLKNNNFEYAGSTIETNFKKIESFLSETTTAVQKTKRTNDLIVSFFVRYKGTKVPTHFSGERRELVKTFDDLKKFEDKERFIKCFGDYADFYKIWLEYDGTKVLNFNEHHDDAELVSMLMLFLKNSNHRMAITTLGAVYQKMLNNEPNATDDFVKVVKATAAFYFIWRVAFSNSGLDIAYRKLFKEKGYEVTVQEIRDYFTELIAERIKKNEWKQKASINLKYSERNSDLIRLALLITSTDTIPDPEIKGSLKEGKEGVNDFLKLKCWRSNDFKTIEHIAPQTNVLNSWDTDLYDKDSMLVHSLGNLTLLPVDLNSSAGNKSFQEKLLYYKCVAEEDQDKLNAIENKAKSLGITMNESTLELLTKCNYSHHIKPLSVMDYYDSWKADLVKEKTNALIDIIWNKLVSWLHD